MIELVGRPAAVAVSLMAPAVVVVGRSIATARPCQVVRAGTARAENRRFWCLSTLRAHTKSPYKMDFHRKP